MAPLGVTACPTSDATTYGWPRREVLSAMDVIEFTPNRDRYAYTFGGAAPVMRVKPGSVLRLWSDDAFGGALRSVEDLSSAKG